MLHFPIAVLAIGSAPTRNLTVYRITPKNYTGITNMDTGDAAGDTFFGLYELTFPMLCSNPRFQRSIGCINEPILSIPGFNVYKKFIVEADARFGEYAQCNPNPDTGQFFCAHFGESSCWDSDPVSAKAFAGVCDPAVCKCEAYQTLALGAETLASSYGPGSNATLPKGCPAGKDSLEPLPGYRLKGLAYNTSSGVSEAECCSLCTSDLSRPLFPCAGYAFDNVTMTCKRFGLILGASRSSETNSAIRPNPTDSPIFTYIGKLAHLLGGNWYSTQAAGECKPGQAIGSGCWWRLIREVRNVNATCVNGRVVNRVIASRPACWQGCPQPTNTSSECWINCLFETIVGNATATPPVPSMQKAELIGAFEGAFADEAEGGCAELPPCPPPCNPPDSIAADMAAGLVRLRPKPYFGPW